MATKEKRKAAGIPEEGDALEESQIALKKLKREQFDPDLMDQIRSTREEALRLWIQQMQAGTDRIYQDLYGEYWRLGKEYESELLAARQAQTREFHQELEQSRRQRDEASRVPLVLTGSYRDDWDPRY